MDFVAIIKSKDDQDLYKYVETFFVQSFLDLQYAAEMEETGFGYEGY